MSTSKHRNQPEPRPVKLYTLIGIGLVLAAVLLLWNAGVFTRDADAVTIGEETFSVTDLNFYYYSVRNTEANNASMYAQYGLDYGYDYTLADDLQMYDEERTYADYFRDMALEQLETITLLCNEAEAEGYEISEGAAAELADSLTSIEAQITYGSLMRGTSEASYIQALYGPKATMKILRENVTRQALANDFANFTAESFPYDEADFEAYYEENRDDLDSYTYRSLFLSGQPETQTDEVTGEEQTPTEEESTAAMEEASAKAEALAERVRRGEDLNTAALDYLPEEEWESLADPDHGYSEGTLGLELTAMFKSWITEEGREPGDVGVLEQEESGYYVVEFLDRKRDDETRKSADAWSVIVIAETTESVDENGETVQAPTEEQLAIAYEEALAFQAIWEASTDRSEEAFNAMLPTADPEDQEDAQEDEQEDAEDEESETPAKQQPFAQMLSDITPGTYGTVFDSFVFAPGQEIGAMGIVEMEESDGAISGYRFVYIPDFGAIAWREEAESGMRGADYEVFFEGLREKTPVTRLEGFSQVGL